MIDMNFTFLCLVISQYLLYEAYAIYNKDVICVIDEGQEPVCTEISRPNRRSIDGMNMPSHDPYIPRVNATFYDCSTVKCKSFRLYSLTQFTSPKLTLLSCFLQSTGNYQCETVRYSYLKNIDKLLFLSKNIHNKTFYTVDCLVYSDGGRLCHKKADVDSYTKLVDIGTILRPNASSIFSQEELVCEEDQNKEVNCDLDLYVPYNDGLKLKQSAKPDTTVLLKTGTHLVILRRNCIDQWCGYSGRVSKSRRSLNKYDPPGGKVYRCYYAKKQQICKELYGSDRPVYNDRGWLSTR